MSGKLRRPKPNVSMSGSVDDALDRHLGTDVAAIIADEFKRANAAPATHQSVSIFAGGSAQKSPAVSIEPEPTQESSTEISSASDPNITTVAASQISAANPSYVESSAGLVDKLLTGSDLSPSRVLWILPALLVLFAIAWMMIQDNSKNLLASSDGVYLLCRNASMVATLGGCVYMLMILAAGWTWSKKLIWLIVSGLATVFLIYLWIPKSSEVQSLQSQSQQPLGQKIDSTTQTPPKQHSLSGN